MELSACFSLRAAVLLANVSGRLVPRATKVIAVMLSSSETRQPKMDARSLMRAVNIAMKNRETKKQIHPPELRKLGGGTHANTVCEETDIERLSANANLIMCDSANHKHSLK